MDHHLLDAALDTCHRALTDYQSGLISDDELRRTLFRAGLVYGANEAVMLDLETGAWRRYDGIAVSNGAVRDADELDVGHDDSVGSEVLRWKQTVEQMRPGAWSAR